MECKFNYLQGNANLDLKIVLDFFWKFPLTKHSPKNFSLKM